MQHPFMWDFCITKIIGFIRYACVCKSGINIIHHAVLGNSKTQNSASFRSCPHPPTNLINSTTLTPPLHPLQAGPAVHIPQVAAVLSYRLRGNSARLRLQRAPLQQEQWHVGLWSRCNVSGEQVQVSLSEWCIITIMCGTNILQYAAWLLHNGCALHEWLLPHDISFFTSADWVARSQLRTSAMMLLFVCRIF